MPGIGDRLVVEPGQVLQLLVAHLKCRARGLATTALHAKAAAMAKIVGIGLKFFSPWLKARHRGEPGAE
jgi:hypothetical protein